MKRLNDNNIIIQKDKVIININNPLSATFSNTGSMMPIISENSRAIQIIPQSEEELYVGDIISYSLNEKTVIHRIVEISYDDYGWFAITKGDNNIFKDTERVRFSQVKRVLVGILY
jgi:signal peptidase I